MFFFFAMNSYPIDDMNNHEESGPPRDKAITSFVSQKAFERAVKAQQPARGLGRQTGEG